MGTPKNISNRKSNSNTDTATSNTVNLIDTLCGIIKELFNIGRACISGFISKNVTTEMDKAIAINVVATATEKLCMNIVEAAEFA